MSNYSQITFFAPKDALISGNPAKIIKGADVDPELAAISVAIATKYDPSNLFSIVPTWTGVHTFSAQPVFNAGINVAAGGAAVVGGITSGSPTGGNLGNGTINATGIFINNVAVVGAATLLSSNNTWTGANVFEGTATATPGTSSFSGGVGGGTAIAYWTCALSAANTGIWRIYPGATQIQFGAINDALSVENLYLQVARSGTTITSMTLGNTTDKPPITLNGPVTIPAPASGFGLTSLGTSTFSQGLYVSGPLPTGIPSAGGLGWTGSNTFLYSFGISNAALSGIQIVAANGNAATTKNVLATTQSGLALTGIAIGNSTDLAPITLNGAAGSTVSMAVQVGGAADAIYTFGVNALVAGAMGFNNTGGTNAYGAPTGSAYLGVAQSFPINFTTSAAARMIIGSAGGVTINAPSSGAALTILTTSSLDGLDINSAAATSAITGYLINGTSKAFLGAAGGASQLITGSAANDFCIRCETGGVLISANGSTNIGLKVIAGNAGIQGLGPVAGGLVDMTPDASSFTGTLTGFASLTSACVWSRNGNQVTLFMTAATGTSTATTMTMTGLPAAIQPTRAQRNLYTVQDAGNATIGMASISGGTITFTIGVTGSAFTASGSKGLPYSGTLSYLLN